MTGYGTSSQSDEAGAVTVEVKSLNSKFLDLNFRLPKSLTDLELDFRNMVAEKLERGKVGISIEYEPVLASGDKSVYNQSAFEATYKELKRLADAVAVPSYDALFQLALNAPDVVKGNSKDELSGPEKEKIKRALSEALSKCDQFRATEGRLLEEKILSNVEAIKGSALEVAKLDPARVERVKTRLKNEVLGVVPTEKLDANRLEQEIIYYIEKLDINEEKVRLHAHLDYFVKVAKTNDSNGKKLGFIAQEIGREINTIGSKANDAAIQHHVVLMKEELEKIKEQLNNVL